MNWPDPFHVYILYKSVPSIRGGIRGGKNGENRRIRSGGEEQREKAKMKIESHRCIEHARRSEYKSPDWNLLLLVEPANISDTWLTLNLKIHGASGVSSTLPRFSKRSRIFKIFRWNHNWFSWKLIFIDHVTCRKVENPNLRANFFRV